MRILRWMNGNIQNKNEYICKQVEVALIEDKMRENRLRWFGLDTCEGGLYEHCLGKVV